MKKEGKNEEKEGKEMKEEKKEGRKLLDGEICTRN